MSFDINNWGRWSGSYNSFPPAEYAYTGIANGGTDTLDIMKADGFFDKAVSFLKVGHVIYLVGEEIAPVFPSRESVVVTGLNPVTVKPLNGIAPIVSAFQIFSIIANPVGLIQIFNSPGTNGNDVIMHNLKINPLPVVIIEGIVGPDTFTLTFNVNPGASVFIDVIIFRQAFS